jgi:hypothetical protein
VDNQFPSVDRLSQLNTTELKELFSKSLEFTAKHLMYLGQLWLELENRGEDLSSLKKGIAIYVPMIAHNRLDARLVVSYAGQKTLLTAMSSLPIQEQKQLAETGKVTYVDPETKQENEIDLIDIGATMIPQIFSDSNIRTTDEQLRLINKAELRPKKSPPKPRLVSKLKVEDDHIVVSNKRIGIDKTLQVLSEHFGCDINQFLREHSQISKM